MADSSTHDPHVDSSGTGGEEERTEVVPPVAETTVSGDATAGEVVGGTHGPVEAVAGVDEIQPATTTAGGAREGGADPVPAQDPTGTSDLERVSETATVLSTTSDLHTVFDTPVSSSTLSPVDVVDSVAAGGSGGGDVGGGGLMSGGVGESSLVSRDAAGGGLGGIEQGGRAIGGVDRGIGERVLSLGGLDVVVGDDVVMEDLGTGERDSGDLRGGDSLMGGAGEDVGGGMGGSLVPDIPPGTRARVRAGRIRGRGSPWRFQMILQ